jgi:diphthamide biosynthesis enzyme Dph1/Dph2-like protein
MKMWLLMKPLGWKPGGISLAVAVTPLCFILPLQKRMPTVSVFILGDTSYSPCCVDEVASQVSLKPCSPTL